LLGKLAANPTSLLAEAVRNLRTSVLLCDLDRPPQIIMSTSSLQGEGKTIQSLALAQSFATGGKSVLLIEGDIRRRVFSRSLGYSDTFGLLSGLSEEAQLGDVVQHNPLLGAVDILAAEASRTNPVDVFSSDRFGQFLDAARVKYDVVLIDTPPLLAVPDSRVIAQHCDAILYAVKWNATPQSTLREGLRLLETVNAKVSGLVLTQIDQRRMEGFGLGSARRYGAGYYSEVN
jgi:capsular exopolysaccharide synthesis family protein